MSEMIDAGGVQGAVQTDAPPIDSFSASEASAPDFSFGDADYDTIFNLPPETGQSDGASDDKEAPASETVTDPPGTHQAAEVLNKEEEAPADSSSAKTDTPAKPDGLRFNEKLNWDDDKVPFRAEYKALKAEYLALKDADPMSNYVNNPSEFAGILKETSPTSYAELGTRLATESAEANPRGWIDYFLETQPDLLAEMVSGRQGMTASRLKAELEFVLDDDAVPEKEEPLPASETAEQKEIRELKEWKAKQDAEAHARQLEGVRNAVFTPIHEAVDVLVSGAGLGIDPAALQGKDFAALDDDTKFKMVVNELMPVYVANRIQSDEKLRSLEARLTEFIEKGDEKSAKALLHPAKIAVTNFASEFLSIMTGQKAKTVKAETRVPDQKKRIPVKSSGLAAGAIDLTSAPDWTAEGFV
ncbi:MAG: hypothetical protein JSS81_07425 [Acidobacteria bacterium]|nr:hypothetical protein [Acidobacteriota bacterium]